ncbi:BnaC04g04850D [Brassica napus]|uniref:(rape) hypothetical protein n=1 Tax=Brassica napus TaxID=3708 RepID=A0A078FWQ7_BRANA|nr:unnamed protein product [Brassica napus]CDY18865.1 BnaC04g04850D [Brassica napus]
MDRVSNLPDEVLCHILSFLTSPRGGATFLHSSLLSPSTTTLCSSTPNMKLSLKCPTVADTARVDVSSASLKTLTIKMLRYDFISTVSFDTPSLVRFKYTGSPEPDFRVVVDMENLVDAHIFLYLCRCHVEEPESEYDHQVAATGYTNVQNLFHGIRNVLNLVLSPATLEVSGLSLGIDKGCGWQAMPALLGNCPRLETLVIEGLIHDVTSMCGPSLGCCPVKVMKIHGFQGTVKGMTMIKLFLDYLPCLEEMRVYVQEENDSPATELEENHGVSKRVLEMFQLYNKSSRSRCNVKLMVGDVLCV